MISHLVQHDGNRVAYAHRPGRGPAIVFLPGYNSDMTGGKATALDAWAAANGRAMLRLDYRGCGASDGVFADYTLADWRDDVLALLDRVVDGPVVLVGSSMGGWLMLLVAQARPERVAAMVGIAAAPDFTDWGFSEAEKDGFADGTPLVVPSAYADEPSVTTAPFWRSGQANLVLAAGMGFEGPVRLLHGQADGDVPWTVALRLAEALRSADVQTILVKDGDHRLSREQDIALLVATVARLVELP